MYPITEQDKGRCADLLHKAADLTAELNAFLEDTGWEKSPAKLAPFALEHPESREILLAFMVDWLTLRGYYRHMRRVVKELQAVKLGQNTCEVFKALDSLRCTDCDTVLQLLRSGHLVFRPELEELPEAQ